MTRIRRALAGTTTAIALLLTPATAQATPTPTTPEHPICATGYRGNPDYDRHCLSTGNQNDARHEWRTGYTPTERRKQCRTALHTGMVFLVNETRGDVLYDTYRNDRAMVRLTAWAGAEECYSLR